MQLRTRVGRVAVWVWILFAAIIGLVAVGVYVLGDPLFLGLRPVQWGAVAVIILGTSNTILLFLERRAESATQSSSGSGRTR